MRGTGSERGERERGNITDALQVAALLHGSLLTTCSTHEIVPRVPGTGLSGQRVSISWSLAIPL